MVRLCPAGGGLSSSASGFEKAARLYTQGDYGAAAALFHEVLKDVPGHPDALHFLGLIAQRAHKTALALNLFEAALAARPDFAHARFNRSASLHLLGRSEEALQSARMTVDSAPDQAEAWDLIGQILKDKGQYAKATEAFAHALILQPDNARFHDNYGALLFAKGDLVTAYRAAQLALGLDPRLPSLLMGNILKKAGYAGRAIEHFARARTGRPDFAEAAASEAMARLQIGDMRQGWALWEQRPDFENDLSALPLWHGQRVEHLLLYEDQGLGDAIQFLRYISLLKDWVSRITLRVRTPLVRLGAENFPDVRVVDVDSAPPAADARCRLSSLPFIFETGLANMPPAPYLNAPVEARAFWREILKEADFPRIGLVWAGNPKFRHDAERSISLSSLQPLLERGVTPFISLQKERTDSADGLFDAAPHLRDFADTAGLIAQLDLVIAVDTATAHLAGALGKPIWILLPFDADWRWLLGREDSPWYGTARLFRQKKPGDWNEVIAAVAQAVGRLAAGDRDVLTPAPWHGESLHQNPNALTLPL